MADRDREVGKTSQDESSAPELVNPVRVKVGIYGTAFFSLSLFTMSAILIPLWMVSLGISPFWIGVAMGVRSLLPMFLSIHGGVLMDRLGTRRVVVTAAFVAMLLFPLYPLMPTIIPILVLQMIFGLAQGQCWSGAQTMYGRLMRGKERGAGWLVFFSNAGNFAGPLMLGAVAEHFGSHAGFGFMCFWAAMVLLFSSIVPVRPQAPDAKPATWRDLMPRIGDYVRAASLFAIPAVAMVMSFTVIRLSNSSVFSSFYVVYLGEFGLGETLIGVLIATASLFATMTPPLVEPLAKRFPPLFMIVGATVGNIVFLAITPLLPSFWMLMTAACFYGACIGLGFPNILMTLSKSVPRADQGISVGLRTTMNRVASLIIPVLMGTVVELEGIEASFFVIAAILMTATVVTAILVASKPGILD